MVAKQLSINSILTSMYKIYLVMPALPQFPDGVGRAATSTADLLGSGEVVAETLKYVKNTGRLSHKQGEVQIQ